MKKPRLNLCIYISDERERRNAIISISDGMLYAVMGGLTTPFWGAFAVNLGAGDYTLAMLSALPALVGLAAQIPSALLVERFSNRLRPTLISALGERIFFSIFACIPFLPIPDAYKAPLFAILYSLRNFPATMAGIAWTSMMGEMFSPRHRSVLFGDRNMLCTFATLISTIVAGPVLDRISWPWNFESLYVVSFGAVMGSLFMLTKHREIPLPQAERERSPAGSGAFRVALTSRPFIRFLIAVLAIHLGFHVTASLWTILWVKIMGLSNAWLGLFSIASGIASLLSYRAWGRLAAKHGNMTILSITALAHVIVVPIYVHFRSPYVYLALNAFAGVAGAGFNLSLFNGLLDVTPSSGRPAYIALYNMVIGLSGFAWPFWGVWLYTKVGMTAALDICAWLRLFGMLVGAFLLLKRTAIGEHATYQGAN